MDIETKTQDGVHVVKLRGRLCMGPPLDRFNSEMIEMLRRGENKIVLDVEEMTTIDSSGIGALMRHLTAVKQKGGSIQLYRPSKFTLQTLKLVNLLNLFRTYEDLGEAIASLQ